MDRLLKLIDKVSDRSGWIVCWLVPVLVVIVTYEVVARYVFRSPTIWAYETTLFLMGVFATLGGAHALLHRSHVTIDILTGRLSLRGRTIVDLVTFLLFLVFMVVLIWRGGIWAWKATIGLQRSDTYWQPYVWPIKWTIPIGAFFLLLQGLADFVRDLRTVISGKGAGEG